MPASDTGAIEMALWSLLGARGVDVLAWDAFGESWVRDAEALKLADLRIFRAPPGKIADLAKTDPARDIVFTWNGTSTGVRVPDANWIAADRQGLTICDATSAVFAQNLDWPKLDVVTFSWQKALGSEAAHGMLVLSPRAVARLESYRPAWPMPKIFRLVDAEGRLDEALFKGWTINTPSLLCVEDYLDALAWAKSVGGLDALIARANANARTLGAWVETTDWVDFLAGDPAIRSNTSLCLNLGRARGGAAARPGAASSSRRNAGNSRRSRRRLRYRRLPAIAAGPAHLVRADGGGARSHAAHGVARLCLRAGAVSSQNPRGRRALFGSGFGQRPDAMRQARDLPGRRVPMDDAVLGGADNHRLGGLQRLGGGFVIAGGNRFLDLADEGAHARTAGTVDRRAMLNFTDGLFGRRGIRHR